MSIISKSKNARDLLLSRLWNKPLRFFGQTTTAIALILGAIAVFIFFTHIFVPPNSEHQDTTVFTIESAERSWSIASSLEEQGLIQSRISFMLYAVLTRNIQSLQSGDYLLSPSMSTHEILQKISRGDIIQESLVIQEGWNLRQIAEEFEKRGLFTSEELFAVTGYPAVDYREETQLPRPKDFSQEFAFLRNKSNFVSLEGYLFPDTYLVSARALCAEHSKILKPTLQSTFSRKLNNKEKHFLKYSLLPRWLKKRYAHSKIKSLLQDFFKNEWTMAYGSKPTLL